MKRKLPIPLLALLMVLALQSCKPGQMSVAKTGFNNCVTSAELSSLNIGMSKSQAVETLGRTYPYDVLAGDFDGCEVFQYKYKKPKKKSKSNDVSRSSLTEGLKLFVDESDAYLLFKEGKLEMVLTAIGRSQVMDMLKEKQKMGDVCAETGLRGCTDKEALNFNEMAIIESGSCEYCPCYFEVNPGFNKKRPVSECNERCIPVRTEEFINGELVIKVGGKVINDKKSEEKICSDCDIIEQLAKSKANVNVTIDLGLSPAPSLLNRTVPATDGKPKSNTQSKSTGSSNAKSKNSKDKMQERIKVTTGGIKK